MIVLPEQSICTKFLADTRKEITLSLGTAVNLPQLTLFREMHVSQQMSP